MRKLFFLGPPGVGKTTIYEKLWNDRFSHSNKWKTSQETIEDFYNKSLGSEFRSNLRKILFRRKYIEYRKNKRVVEDTIFQANKERYDLFLDIAIEGIFSYFKDAFIKVNAINFLLRLIKIEILCDASDSGVFAVFDDSIWQSLRLSCENTFRLEELDKSVFPDFVFYCFSDRETIYSQLQKRKAEGKTNNTHKNISSDQLYELVDLEILNAQRKTDFLRDNGVKVYSFDLRMPFKETIKSMTEILGELC